ncbi:MAG: L,D-transpeptidase family protein [Bacteroidota bacterium]
MTRTRTILLGLALTVGGTAAWAHAPTPQVPAGSADRVVVDKSERRLWLMAGDAPLATYPVSFGARLDNGHKQREGDERTPEGVYTLDWRNPDSCCHRSLHVSYPNAEDVARAEAAGEDPGGMIMIHGLINGTGWLGRLHRLRNWTDGCIAVTNDEMDRIWDAVPDGTPIEIRP